MFSKILYIVPFWLLLDLYFFRILKTAVGGLPLWGRRCICWMYWLVDILLIGALLYLKLTGSGIFSSWFFSLVGPVLLSFLPKLLALPFLLLEDLTRLGVYALNPQRSKTHIERDPHPKSRNYPERRRFISQVILGLSAVPFGYVLFGITKGRYHYKVHRSTLYFTDLPDAFDGFTITQLSDIHCGSFNGLDDLEAVKRGIDLANTQKSDLMVFTGDLINNDCEELETWKSTLSVLKSPYGVYSILGNHDYGDYKDWPSEEAKAANLDRLKTVQSEIGFRLLLDERVKLEKDGQFINLVGVQNWGRRFRQYADLNKAMEPVEENSFSIVLSHDPTHWEGEILQHPKSVHLTLAGHTHGMQFGVDIPGIKWSPAKYMYEQWAGIYRNGSKYLNVNRGFGFLGFQGRVGIWPEISVITLKKQRIT